jgi:hypothetical protein
MDCIDSYSDFIGYATDRALQISGIQADGRYGLTTRVNCLALGFHIGTHRHRVGT